MVPRVFAMAASSVGSHASVLLIVLVALVVLLSLGGASASDPDGRVQGFITDSGSGNSIAGASVRIEASDFPWAFDATTDSSGYFEIALPPHRYAQTAWSPAHLVNVTQVAVGSRQTIWANMTLRPASSRSARLQGYATDSVSSAPVTVGRIVARPWIGSFTNYMNASALNGSGYYQMDLVASSYDVATDGVLGYTPYDYYPVYLGAGEVLWHNLSLDPNPVNSWINGTVYDQTNSTPITGAQITARVDGSLSLPSVTSDVSGRYSMPVPSGTIDLAADAPGYAPATTSVYVWSGGGSYFQDVYLIPLAETIRGYLTDGVTGAPMAGVLVTVSPLFFAGYYDQATTNASGAYAIRVPDDYYIVSARQTGYTPWSMWVIRFNGGIAWANGTLWPIISQIKGYLRDAVNGSAIPGLVISAIDLRTSYQVMTTADPSGFYSVDVPPSPAMSVWVYGNAVYAGNVAYVGTQPYETTWVNITVDRLTAQISLNVTNGVTGAPVAGVSVIAAWFYGNAYAVTDANGSATVNAPTGVEVYVTVIATGYDFWTGVLTPAAGANSLSIALWPDLPFDVHIVGYVRDASSGTGLSSVSVEADWGSGATSTTYTNSTGFYDLSTVAAPQTVRPRETGYAGSQATVSPSPGDVLWVNLTLAPDNTPPQVVSFTATPATGLDPTNPAALVANVNEAQLERADLSIWMMHSSSAGVGTFLNLGYRDPSTVSIANPANGSYSVHSSWDTRTRVARLTDGLSSTWWPALYLSPFLAGVSGYYDDATLPSQMIGNAVFDTRDGRFLFVITTSGFFGPTDKPGATFAPFASGMRIDLTTAAILGYTLVTGPTYNLPTLHLTVASAVPSGTYAGVLELRDAARGYTTAAVLMQTVADTTPPVANAGANMAVDEDAAVTLNGTASNDNVGIANYTWTFTDGTPHSLYGAAPTYTFGTPGTYVLTLTVRDGDGNVATDMVTVTVRDATSPTVSISAPVDGLRFSGSLAVKANATDNVGVDRVELLVDGAPMGTDTAAPFEFVLAAGSLSVGNHTITVIAFDAAGNSASQVRQVTVAAASGSLLPDVVILGGFGLLLVVAIVAAALFFMRRRRPRRPAAAPSSPPGPEASPEAVARTEEQPIGPAAPEPREPQALDSDFDELPPG